MAEISRPWDGTVTGDAGPYSSAQWQDIFNTYSAAASTLTTPISPPAPLSFATTAGGVVAGDRNELLVNGVAAAATVTLTTGSAIVAGVWYENTANIVINIPANGLGVTRIDAVVLVYDNVAQTVRHEYRVGTAAPPVITVATELVLAWVTVTTSSQLSDIFDAMPLIGNDRTVAQPCVIDETLLTPNSILQRGTFLYRNSSGDQLVPGGTAGANKFAGVLEAAYIVGEPFSQANSRVISHGLVEVNANITGSFLAPNSGAVLPTVTTSTRDAVVCKIVNSLLPGVQRNYGYLDAGMLGDSDIREPRLIIEHTQNNGVNGGNTAAATWNVRPITATVANEISGASVNLGANQFTLPAGTYEIDASAFMYNAFSRLRLRTTGGTTSVSGVQFFEAGDAGHVDVITGRFTITASTTFELQHYSVNAVLNGLGAAISTGEPEQYMKCIITKV